MVKAWAVKIGVSSSTSDYVLLMKGRQFSLNDYNIQYCTLRKTFFITKHLNRGKRLFSGKDLR